MSFSTQFLDFFMSNAWAANPAAPQQGQSSFFIMIGIFLFFMYFVIIRPQQKRAKEQRNLLNTLTPGDEIITTGGVLGKIVKISEQYLTIALNENTEIVIQKSSVASLLPKGTLKSI